MKNCPNCSAPNADDATACAGCGQAFAPLQQPATARGTLRRRPDGTTLMGLGWSGIGLSVILFLFFLISRGNGSAEMAYYAGSGRGSVFLLLLAQGLFSVGLLTLLTGAVVRALWFLPGPDNKLAP
jgi:hypothetical protein